MDLIYFVFFILIINFRFVKGVCDWPTEFQNTSWTDSSKGDIEFTRNKLTGWSITISAVSPPQNFDTWLCHSTDLYVSHNILVLITESTFNPYGSILYGYICIELIEITTASYRYYLRNPITSGVNYERIQMSVSGTESNWDTLCLFDDTYASLRPEISEYRVMIDKSQVTTAKIDCPYVFLGTYRYNHSDSNGMNTCDISTSVFTMCNDATDITFDYNVCPTQVAYSKSDTVWCVDTVMQNGNNFVTLYNGNDGEADIDDISTHRFSCISISSDLTVGSVSPGSCKNGQTPDTFSNNGTSDIGAVVNLVQTETCVTCPNVVVPTGGSVSYSTNGAVTIVTYSCNADYSLAGPEVRTCRSNNTWTDDDPTCTCILPEPPSNGSMIATSDGILTYYCDVGFVLSGDQTRSCQINSNTWSGAEPVCDLCEEYTITEGLITNMTTDGLTSTSMFSCSAGYTLDGAPMAVCQTTGVWNETIPSCVRCDSLSSTNTMTVNITTDGLLSSADFDCVTGYQLSGESTATCDVNGTWNQEPSCVCSFPNSPSQSVTVYNGTEATFTCNIGYTLVGSSYIICLDDGTGWNDTSPSCVTCTGLSNPTGGYFNTSTDGYVTMATFYCYNGYTLSGDQTLTCLNDGSWNSSSPTCEMCPVLSNPDSGLVNITTDGVTTIAQYSCMSGYTISGSALSTCLNNGTWFNLPPTCNCSPLSLPDNGNITSNDGVYVYYSCNVNYSMNGESVRQCMNDGTGWTGQDITCVECAKLDALDGGDISYDTDGMNTQVVYSCSAGYTLDGYSDITCLANGSWQYSQSSCVKCANLSSHENGNYILYTVDSSTVSKAAYTCDKGYTLKGFSELTCQQNGDWNRVSPSCVKCDDRDHPSSGNFTLTTNGLQTRGLYTCNDGYILNGTSNTACTITGDWNDPEPSCECVTPEAPQNGSIKVNQPSITYTCDIGYTLFGNSTGICYTDGTGWSIDTPLCVECDSVNAVPNGNITYGSNGVNTYIEVSCKEGTTISGSTIITCNDNGTWDRPLPDCVTCSSLPEVLVPSGFVTVVTNGTTTIANYSCPNGYRVQGSQTIECLFDGTWSDSPAECVCEEPVLTEGSGYTISDDGLSMTFTCDQGYTIDGPVTAECNTDGTGWNMEYPNCTKCDNVTAPLNGGVALVSNGTHTTVEFSCGAGYTLSDVSVPECRTDGTWSSTVTSQSCVSCATLPDVSVVNGSVGLSTNGTHTFATYSCPNGYKVNGEDTLTCNNTGQWDSASLDCVCEPPTSLNGGNFTIADDGYSVTFSCSEGYTMNGNQEIACATDGTGWSLSYPTCLQCDDTIPPDDGNVAIVTDGIISTAIYTCNVGTSLYGNTTAECQLDGTWNITEPTCVACPNLPNVTVVTGYINITTNGKVTKAHYYCPTGYIVTREENVTCNTDGTWSSEPSDCVCEPPSLLQHGNYTLSTDGLTIEYRCDIGYIMMGEYTSICSNDGTGWSEEAPNCLKCEDVSPPLGGNINMITNGTHSEVVYTCDVGFSMNGDYTRLCMENTTWTGTSPQCVECDEVTDIDSGIFNIATNGTTTSVEYYCSSGYSLDGSSSRTCLYNGSWDNNQPNCYCSPPDSLLYGSSISNETTVIYSCLLGYSMNGTSVRTCKTNSMGWSDASPKCVLCSTLVAPTNGTVTFNTDGIVTEAIFTCNVGYTMHGSTLSTCNDDGTWSNDIPTCVQCGELSDPIDGTLNITTNGTHTVASYTCNIGTTLIGTPSIICLTEVIWSDQEPVCELCPSLTTPYNGDITLESDGLSTKANLTCMDGYYANGNTLISCLGVAGWSDDLPACLCNQPALENGTVVSNGLVANFKCNLGYSLYGDSQIFCGLDGNRWNNSLPTCVKCSDLSTPNDGKIKMSTNGYNTRARVSCDTGTSLNGSEVLYCGTDGSWNASNPICVKCEDLIKPTNGQFTMSSDGTISSVELKCDSGYQTSGLATIQCGPDGSWLFEGESSCKISDGTVTSLMTILIIVCIVSVVIITVLSILLARFVYFYCKNKNGMAGKYFTNNSHIETMSNVVEDDILWKSKPSVTVLSSKAPASHASHLLETSCPFTPSPAPESFAASPSPSCAISPMSVETHRSGSSLISFRRNPTTLTKNSLASVNAISITENVSDDLPITKTNGVATNIALNHFDKPPNRLKPLPNHQNMVGKLNTSSFKSPEDENTNSEDGRSSRPQPSNRSSSRPQFDSRSGTPLLMNHSILTNDYNDVSSMDSVSIID